MSTAAEACWTVDRKVGPPQGDQECLNLIDVQQLEAALSRVCVDVQARTSRAELCCATPEFCWMLTRRVSGFRFSSIFPKMKLFSQLLRL